MKTGSSLVFGLQIVPLNVEASIVESSFFLNKIICSRFSDQKTRNAVVIALTLTGGKK